MYAVVGFSYSAVAAGFPFAIEKQGSDRLVQSFLARLGPLEAVA